MRYRTELKTLTAAELEEYNSLHGTDYDSAEKELDESFSRLEELDQKEIRRLLDHPDERLLLSFVSYTHRVKAFEETTIRDLLLHKGIEISKEEGLDWHPLFDSMSDTNTWRFYSKEGFIPEEWALGEYTNIIREKCRTVTTEEDVLKLIEFKDSYFVGVLFENMRAFPGELKNFVEERPRYKRDLASNNALPEEWRHEFMDEAIETLVGELAAYGEESGNGKFSYSDKEMAGHVVEDLLKSGYEPDEGEIETIVSDIVERGQSERYLNRALMAFGDELREEQLWRILKNVPVYEQERLLNHPSANLEMRLHCIKNASGRESFDLKKAAVEKKWNLDSNEMLAELIKTTSMEVLEPLMNSHLKDPKLFKRALKKALGQNANAIAQAIEYINSGQEISPFKKWVKRVQDEHWDVVRGQVVKQGLPIAMTKLMSSPQAISDQVLQQKVVSSQGLGHHLLLEYADRFRGEAFRLFASRLKDTAYIERLITGDFAGLDDLKEEDVLPLLQSKNRKVRTSAITILGRIKEQTGQERDKENREKARAGKKQ